jgi:glutamyl-tRNA(Gln) amidotransferase subunit D
LTEQNGSGYRGKALQAITKAKITIGDRIRATKGEQAYEGILIPRSEYADENHIVIKLKNGYNLGITLTPETSIEKIGEGTKPAFAAPALPKENENLPKVVVMSTGGTIASRVDYRTGAVRPALTANDLYSVVPELSNIARIDAQILYSLFSENITPKHWTEIAQKVAQEIRAGVDGVVLTHGTDTMGYTSAALSFALQDLPVPVILVGSQRSADRPSSDAPTNLIGAVTAAAYAPLAEVTLAFHESPSDTTIVLHRGTKVRKCHTSRRDTFRSINASPIAKVENQKVVMLTENFRRRDASKKLVLKPEFDDKVALLKFHPGMDPRVLEWYLDNDFKGLILEGTGLGHVSKFLHGALRAAAKKDIVVGMASQCIWGRVNMNVYYSGRDLLSLGVIPLEDMLAETALVKLMWIFGQTHDMEEAKVLLRKNLVGEFSPRTLLDRVGNG